MATISVPASTGSPSRTSGTMVAGALLTALPFAVVGPMLAFSVWDLMVDPASTSVVPVAEERRSLGFFVLLYVVLLASYAGGLTLLRRGRRAGLALVGAGSFPLLAMLSIVAFASGFPPVASTLQSLAWLLLVLAGVAGFTLLTRQRPRS